MATHDNSSYKDIVGQSKIMVIGTSHCLTTCHVLRSTPGIHWRHNMCINNLHLAYNIEGFTWVHTPVHQVLPRIDERWHEHYILTGSITYMGHISPWETPCIHHVMLSPQDGTWTCTCINITLQHPNCNIQIAKREISGPPCIKPSHAYTTTIPTLQWSLFTPHTSAGRTAKAAQVLVCMIIIMCYFTVNFIMDTEKLNEVCKSLIMKYIIHLCTL